MNLNEPKIDLSFQIIGKRIKVDHGAMLHGALSNILPFFHNDDSVGVKLIRGRYIGGGYLDISPISNLVLRLPASRIIDYISIAGKTIEIAGDKFRIGVFSSRSLIPSVAVHSHIVTTRNGHDEKRFKEEITRQLSAMGIRGTFVFGKRRTFQIHGKQIVGYEMIVTELTAEESIKLQEQGLGGRRKMGCGIFEPWGN